MNIGMIPAKYARLTPQAEALIDHSSGQRISFAALDEQVRRLANGLLSLGLEKGDRVAMLSQNSIEFMVLYFACGRAGLIAQPLNWRLAAPELAKIVKDSAPRVLIAQQRFAETATALQGMVDCVGHWLQYGPSGDGSYERLVAAARADEPAQSDRCGGEDPLYILYTGGTTGESKGVLHTHMSTYYAMMNNTAAERIMPSDVYMLTGQMFHSPVVMALTYLAHGRPVVLINFEPKLAMELIQEERVSGFIGLTTMINWMMAVENFTSYDTSSLRHIMYGGGPLPSSVVREAMGKFGCNFIGVYGQTEGIAMTFLGYDDHTRGALRDIHPERLNSCGREAFMTSLMVVDEQGRPVPQDGRSVGEIVVRSPANMVGYWRRPELTAQTIRNGWMHTGDIAAWDSESYVFIVDRAKDMIISGGENIYSIQVEEAIYKHPAVLEAAVIGVPDPEWGEAVAAYVVLRAGASASAQDIIEVTRQHLASYQKPRIVEFVRELPKAPTGKILKRVLRDAHWSGRERQV
jgi:long-chain acyl-CoA synthetase